MKSNITGCNCKSEGTLHRLCTENQQTNGKLIGVSLSVSEDVFQSSQFMQNKQANQEVQLKPAPTMCGQKSVRLCQARLRSVMIYLVSCQTDFCSRTVHVSFDEL